MKDMKLITDQEFSEWLTDEECLRLIGAMPDPFSDEDLKNHEGDAW